MEDQLGPHVVRVTLLGSTVTRSPQRLLDSLHGCPCVRRPAPQSSQLWSKNGSSSYQDSNRLQRGAQRTPSGGLVIDSRCLGSASCQPREQSLLSVSHFSRKLGRWHNLPPGGTDGLSERTRGVQRSAWLWWAPQERSCWVRTAGNSFGIKTDRRLRGKGLP